MADSFHDAMVAGYALAEPALVIGSPMDGTTALPDVRIQVALSMLNRHGLIAGATGTGKTKTLQLLAGQLSMAGVPVLDRRHQGRPDRPRPARRRDQPEGAGARG